MTHAHEPAELAITIERELRNAAQVLVGLGVQLNTGRLAPIVARLNHAANRLEAASKHCASCARCTTAGTFGNRVALTGMHATRVRAAREREARRSA